MSVNHARNERSELCDLFEALGRDVPTLCEGWSASDLAAHLVVRERRPDAALGILASPFADHGEKVRRQYAQKPWHELIDMVRSGPPTISIFAIPGIDRLANTMEYFIHHEDLRRPNGLDPRHLDPDFEGELWNIVGRMSKMFMRKAPTGVALVATGEPDRRIVAHAGQPMVEVTGPVGELALFIYGRQEAAQVALDGPSDAVEAIHNASFGI